MPDMKVQLNKWGNSLALRIPGSFLKQLNLGKETALEMTLEGDKIILAKEKPDLAQLLKKVTFQNLHPETKTGKSIGRELW